MKRTNSRKPMAVAVCYGFMEGPMHGRRLKKLLQAAGYRSVDCAEADIIIAHSAGCGLVPKTAQPKLVVYTGMPLVLARPQRTWISASLTSLRREQLRHQLSVRLKNTYAGLRQPRRMLGIMRDPKIAQPVIFPQAQTIFIANHHDPWPKGPELDKLIASKPWAFISLPGAHENLWEEPQHYVTIINHYAELLG